MTLEFDAIVLAGGRGRRLGGVDKAELRIGGKRLIDRACGAAWQAHAAQILVVGPDHAVSPNTIVVRERPPFGGPLAAVASALPHVRAPWILLLACDLEYPERVVERLVLGLANLCESASKALEKKVDGVVLSDEDGYMQWLAGIYATEPLRRGMEQIDGPLGGLPMRALFRGLRLAELGALNWETADIDLPEHLERARKRARGEA